MNEKFYEVGPRKLTGAINLLKEGGYLYYATAYRTTVIKNVHLAAWERAGKWLLKEEGDGYRIRSGKGSVYLFPGQLKCGV